MISAVFPVYNEEGSVAELHARLKRTLDSFGEEYEIIAVDDGSRDRTREILSNLTPLKLVVLARNFGQNAAIDAGLKHARGDIVVTLDGDLQNPPEEIPKLVRKLKSGFDVVVGRRKNRQDSFSRRFFSKLANQAVYFFTGVKLHDFGCALKCYRSFFIQDLRLLGETFIFLPIIAHSRGAKIAEVEVHHAPRQAGLSKHGIGDMSKVLFDLISVKFFISYFGKPLRFFGILSLFSLILASMFSGWAIILKIWSIKNFSDTPLLLIAILFIILAVLLFMLGFIVEILLRIYYTKDVSPYKILEIVENRIR